MDEPVPLPLWIDLAAVGFGGMQGGMFGALWRDERNEFDILGVAVFALVLGLGGGIVRDVLLGQVPAALRDDTYLLVAVLAGLAGRFLAELAGRLRWIDALDALVVGLFVIVGRSRPSRRAFPVARSSCSAPRPASAAV